MREADSKSAFYRQGSWLVIATFVSGVLMFAVHIFGGWMSREEYGLFVTLLQILNLMMIPALGLQTVFAQQTAAAIEPQQQFDLAKSTRKMLLICLFVWMAIAVLVLLNQGAILESLKIEKPTALYVTLLLGLPQLWLPVLLGILQGRQNFAWLGGAAIANGVGRFAAIGIIVALLGGQAAGATTGVLIGLTTACLLAGWHGRQVWLGQSGASRGNFEAKAWLKRIIPLTLGLGAGQFMLSADMIAARAILPEADSGPYGAAGMIGRGLVVFTGPLAAVMFPKLVREAAGTKSRVLFQALLGTAILGVLAGSRVHTRRLAAPGHRRPLPRLGREEKNTHRDHAADSVFRLEHVAAGVGECFRGGAVGQGAIPRRALAGWDRRRLRVDVGLAGQHRRAAVAADNHSHPGRLQPRVPRHGSGLG